MMNFSYDFAQIDNHVPMVDFLEESIMNIAQQYLQKQLADAEFRGAYFEEKTKLDIEYQLEELKQAIRTNTRVDELIRKIDAIEQYVQAV